VVGTEPWARGLSASWSDAVVLSIAAFAEKHQMSKSALYYWRRRLSASIPPEARQPQPPTSSTALEFIRLEPSVSANAASPIEVLLRNGRVVRVPVAFDDHALARVLDVAEGGAL